MVGNMGGTSLAMAPAALIGQFCDVLDLDGPLFLASDRMLSVSYEEGRISVPPGLWGAFAAGAGARPRQMGWCDKVGSRNTPRDQGARGSAVGGHGSRGHFSRRL
jgi:hypothetical protein